MINLRLSISIPWLDRFESLYAKAGNTPFKYKFWEFQILKSNDLITLDSRITTRQDHAGLDLWIGLVGYAVNFVFYDSRHWDYENKCWTITEEQV